jgi:hypothetical protein
MDRRHDFIGKGGRKDSWFNVPTRRAFVTVTPGMQACATENGIRGGLVWVNAIPIQVCISAKEIPCLAHGLEGIGNRRIHLRH